LAGWGVVVVVVRVLLIHCGFVDPDAGGELHGECDFEEAHE
jgi:hypothetical protein